MSKSLNLTLGTALVSVLLSAPAFAEKLGLGRVALPEEIAAWDEDVRPDGQGLPVGSGDVLTGEEVFSANCAVCHGEFAEGVDNWPKLAGGAGTLDHDDPLKTVGSFWPHLSTTFDYVNRSMPYGNAGTLSADDVYAITAYILYSNDLVDEDFVLSNENFAEVVMPNADNFIVDDRKDSEYALFSATPCMENCKETVEITMRAAVLDVTPNVEETLAPVVEVKQIAEAPAAAPEVVVQATAEAPPAVEAAPVAAAADPALISAGEKVFKQCAACHKIGDNAKNSTGPIMTGIIGRTAGTVDGYKYSKPMKTAGEDGLVWDAATLDAYLADPKGYIPRGKMSFAGLKKAEDRAAVIAYLSTFGG
ncbi:MAG: c-type cytochrome [Rhodobacteraceae bacterium]|nr:c-type cytochrome [Paracoccaceae bacterium]